MDERTLQVIIKAQADTARAFAEVIAQMEALKAAAGDSGGGAGGGGLGAVITALQARFAQLMAMMPAIGLAFAALTVVAIAPLIVALGALIANTIAWTTLAAVAIPVIGGLAFAIFQLGAANAGGLSPASEMVKAHQALATAINNHQTALSELAAAQSGVDVYALGKGQKTENVFLAQQYVTATGQVLADTQHDIKEPASGLNGPIANLGSAIDNMRHHFEEASRTMAEHIALWAMQFLPAIQSAGDSIERWFGQRLPGILNILKPIVQDLGGFFRSIATEVGRVIDYVIAHQAEFNGFFQGLLGFLSGTFKVFLDSMMNVATWFQQNWPAISKAAGDAAKNIGDGFSPWIGPLQTGLGIIKDQFRWLGEHANDLKPIQEVFGFLAGGVITAVTGALGTFLATLQSILWVVQQLQGTANQMGGHITGGGHGGVGGPHIPSLPTPLASGNVVGRLASLYGG